MPFCRPVDPDECCRMVMRSGSSSHSDRGSVGELVLGRDVVDGDERAQLRRRGPPSGCSVVSRSRLVTSAVAPQMPSSVDTERS